MIGKVVRDSGIHAKSEALEARHAYYLRSTARSKPHVDHVCECQFLGHAIVQSPGFSRGGGGSLLAAVDVQHAYNEGHTGLGTQGPAVQSALRPLYNIQNCVGDEELFNLKLLDGSLNITKGHIFHTWLDARRDGRGARGSGGGGLDLYESFRRCKAFKDGRVDEDTVAALASSMERELRVVEGGYYSRLEDASDAAPEGASVRDRLLYKERFVDVAETMKMMFDECLG